MYQKFLQHLSVTLATKTTQASTFVFEFGHELPREILLEIMSHIQPDYLYHSVSHTLDPSKLRALQSRQRILARLVKVNRAWNQAYTHLLYQMVFINSDLHLHLFRRTLDQCSATRTFVKCIGIEPQHGYYEEHQTLSSTSPSFFNLGSISDHWRKRSYLRKLQKSISDILQLCGSLVHVSVEFAQLNAGTVNAAVALMNGSIVLPKGLKCSVRQLTIRIQGNIFPLTVPMSYSHFNELESLTFYDTHITDSPPIFSELGRVHTLKIVDTSFNCVRNMLSRMDFLESLR